MVTQRLKRNSMKLTLTYFDFPFWRAEVSRLALFIGGVDFTDHRPSREEFQALKESGVLPFGQLPTIEVDGARYAQSIAIARFCGQLAGLYPKDDLIAGLRVDELLDAMNELNYSLYPSMREQDPERKQTLRAIFSSEVLPKWLRSIEARLLSNEESSYLVGAQMTIADLALWRVNTWLTSGILDGVPTTVLNAYPALHKHCELVARHPKVIEWIHRSPSSGQ